MKNVGVNVVPDFVQSFFIDSSGESREEEPFSATWTSDDFSTKEDRECWYLKYRSTRFPSTSGRRILEGKSIGWRQADRAHSFIVVQ